MNLRRFFNNLSIRSKLFIYAGILTFCMLIFGFYAVYQANVIQGRQIPARSAVREMQSALLSLRIYEQQFIHEADSIDTEFYSKHTNDTLDAWQKNYQHLESNRDYLRSLYKDTDLDKELSTTISQTTQYRASFQALIETYWQRGYESFGKEGTLQKQAETLETRLQNRPASQITFSKLKDIQNGFLLYKKEDLVTAFSSQAAQLSSQLTAPGDRSLLNEYVQSFNEVVMLEKKIGLSSSEGLRGELNQLMAKLIPKAEVIEGKVLAATSEGINAILRSIIVVIVFLSLVSITTAILIARFIVRRIDLIAIAAQRVTKGDADYRPPFQSTDELGRLSGLFGIMVERLQKNRQTIRRRAHELETSVKRFELVSRAVNEAIYEWDINHDILIWGEGLASVFGHHPKHKQTPVEWWVAHIHPDDAQSIETSLNKHLQRHSSNWKKEYRFKRANGSYAYCQDRGFIEYENGQPIRMVGSLVDVTRQKELDRAKNEFISIASHQLRTPLGSIRWNLELLLEKIGVMPKEDGELVQEAYDSTRRMGNLVNDLLSVARIEQGRVQDIPQATDLVEVLRAAVKEMQPIAKQHHITIDESMLQHKKAELVIDPKRFREVVQNLLSNAVKYTPSKGKVTLALATTQESFTVTIADTGIGIPPEDQNKMFGKFYRAKNVLTTDTEGSGLGLFVVKSYVEAWGGRVWFTSVLNKGTTFYISIPRKSRRKKASS